MPRKKNNRVKVKEDFPDTRPLKHQTESGLLGRLARLLPLALILSILGFSAMMLGSLHIRKIVVARLEMRALAAASVVLSAPYTVALESDIEKIHLSDRLKRLGFREMQEAVSAPGEYRFTPSGLEIYLREAILGKNNTAREQLVRIELAEKKIQQIRNQQGTLLDHFDLEPEVISLLGNSATRASTPLTLDQFPKHLINSVLAIEDERFYLHFGLDLVAIARAILVNLQHGGFVQGGSTITQQLAKNLLLSNERTLERKAIEAIAAPLLETAYTKDEILQFYLNEVFLGQEGHVAIHGFGEAAQSFFAKDVRDINLAESALLAGLIKAPSKYAPRAHMDRSRARQHVVLEKMWELGFITEEELEAAKITEITIQPAQRARRVAPYFIDYVRRELEEKLDLESLTQKRVRVYTGIDREYQECAEQAIDQGLANIYKQHPKLKKRKQPLQAALVSVVPHSGEIRAWVGGTEYGANQFDRISLAKRQPGSAFKPFVYLTAFDKSLNEYRVARTTSTLADEPLTINVPGSGSWSPENYDKEYRGEVSVRYALTHSLNVPTVNLATKIGVESVARTAQLFGFGENLPRVPALALGAGEVSPLELAQAYGVLANGGVFVKLRPLVSVGAELQTDNIYTWPYQEELIASKQAVYVLTDVLRSVVENGTGHSVRRAGYVGPAAGKTGTTNGMRDAWFAGFTPSLLAVVWVGFDDNSPLGLTGGASAAPIWAEYMKCVSGMEPELNFVPPEGVVFRQIDPRTGLLADESCRDGAITELFVSGTEPITTCSEQIDPEELEPPALQQENLPSGLPPARTTSEKKPIWQFW